MNPEEVNTLLSKSDAFRNFLSNKPAKEVVGTTCDGAGCPIACWIIEVMLQQPEYAHQPCDVEVNDNIIKCFCGTEKVFNWSQPWWMRNFVQNVDFCSKTRHVTAEFCLSMLDK